MVLLSTLERKFAKVYGADAEPATSIHDLSSSLLLEVSSQSI